MQGWQGVKLAGCYSLVFFTEIHTLFFMLLPAVGTGDLNQ